MWLFQVYCLATSASSGHTESTPLILKTILKVDFPENILVEDIVVAEEDISLEMVVVAEVMEIAFVHLVTSTVILKNTAGRNMANNQCL